MELRLKNYAYHIQRLDPNLLLRNLIWQTKGNNSEEPDYSKDYFFLANTKRE